METAESLGLNGKKVSITITKIGGEEGQMKTKEFKVQVTSLVNRTSFVVKAIGIPRISDVHCQNLDEGCSKNVTSD